MQVQDALEVASPGPADALERPHHGPAVEDHARALYAVVSRGEVGLTYNIGGHNEKTNLQVVHTLCDLLEVRGALKPAGVERFRDLITFVKDRPGHDKRYAVDAGKIQQDLGWTPQETFESGLRKTVDWYLDNRSWWTRVLSGDYALERIGEHQNEAVEA